jgi:predicted nucleotidyltransferase
MKTTPDRLLTALKVWAEETPGIEGVLLVGSYARCAARPDSDVDVVILAQNPQALVADPSFLERFGRVGRREKEDWGRLTSWRVWYEDGLEVEFGITDVGWAEVPPDPGSGQVVADGAQIVWDGGGQLTELLAAVRNSGLSWRRPPA